MSQHKPSLTPDALRLMVKIHNLLARDGINIPLNEADSHTRLIDIAERFNDEQLRQLALKLKEQVVYSAKQANIIRRMSEILSNDGIQVDVSAHGAVDKLIKYSEHFRDKELKKLGRQLKSEQTV